MHVHVCISWRGFGSLHLTVCTSARLKSLVLTLSLISYEHAKHELSDDQGLYGNVGVLKPGSLGME